MTEYCHYVVIVVLEDFENTALTSDGDCWDNEHVEQQVNICLVKNTKLVFRVSHSLLPISRVVNHIEQDVVDEDNN